MNDKWDGKDRRNQLGTEHRLTVIEILIAEDRKATESLHARFSEFDHEQKAEIRIMAEDIKDTIRSQQVGYVACKTGIEKRLTGLESLVEKVKSFYKGAAWITVSSTGLAGLIYKIMHHGGEKLVK